MITRNFGVNVITNNLEGIHDSKDIWEQKIVWDFGNSFCAKQ